MVFRGLIILLSLSLLLALPELSFAQNQGGTSTQKTTGPRKQLTTIVFAGIAGAILGLSTLSFYGRPQDKLSNIAVGFAVGIITGACYTTYKAATAPRDFYRESQSDLLQEQERNDQMRLSQGAPPPFKVGWTLHF